MASADYGALAKQYGGQAAPAPSGGSSLANLASKYGGVAKKAPSENPVVSYVGDKLKEAGQSFKQTGQEFMSSFKTATDTSVPAPERTAATLQTVERGILGPFRSATDVLFSPVADVVKLIADNVSNIPAVQRAATSDSVSRILDSVNNAGITLGDAEKSNPGLAPDIKNVTNLLLTIAGEKPVEAAAQKATEVAGGVAKKTVDTVGDTLGKTSESAGKALSAPFKEAYKPDVAEAFARHGIEPPVSAVSGSKVVQSAEAVAQNSIIGGKAVTAVIDEARRKLFDITESLRKDVAPEKLTTPGATPESAGKAIQEAVTKARESFNESKTKLYDAAESSIGKQQADLTETRATLESIISSKASSLAPDAKAQVRFYQQILNGTRTAAKRTYQVIKQTRSDIGRKLKNPSDPIRTGDQGALARLYAALSKDLDVTISKSSAEGAKAIKNADAFFKAGIARINSLAGRTIYRSKSPELLVDKLVRPEDISTVRDLKSLVGPEAFKTFAAAFMNKIIADAIVPITGKISVSKLSNLLAKYGDDVLREVLGQKGLDELKDLRKAAIVEDIVDAGTARGKVQPGQLARAIEKYGEKTLKEVFDPAEFQKLMDVEKMSAAMAKGTKIAEGSPTFEKGSLLVHLILGATTVKGLLATIGGEWGLTKLVTSKIGKQFLTEGIGKGSNLANAGGKASGGGTRLNYSESLVPGANEAVPRETVQSSGANQPPKTPNTVIKTAETAKAPSEKPIQGANIPQARNNVKKDNGAGTAAFGLAAGVQTDDKGRVKVSPWMAALGVAGAGVLARVPVAEITTKTLDRILEGAKSASVSRQFIEDLTKRGDIKQGERELIQAALQTEGEKVGVQGFVDKVRAQLLPLDRMSVKSPSYENISLDSNIRGPVAKYSEHIYRSPIETSAAGVHFGNVVDPASMNADRIHNYFAHTRVEDLAVGDTKIKGRGIDGGPIYDIPAQAGKNRYEIQTGDKNYGAILDNETGKIVSTHKTLYEARQALQKLQQKTISNVSGGTRRIVEIQSDLFQKGRLEKESGKSSHSESEIKAILQTGIPEIKKMIQDGKGWDEIRPVASKYDLTDTAFREKIVNGDKKAALNDFLLDPEYWKKELATYSPERKAEIAKLEPYRNTWWERIVREEVAQAGKDGKTILQIPTGETAMKIEGLGSNNMSPMGGAGWALDTNPELQRPWDKLPDLTKENMKVGSTIIDISESEWVITDVMGNGKFKAVPKNGVGADELKKLQAGDKETIDNMEARRVQETFDISGEIDKENPIYKFYQKEVGRYLSKQYGAKLVTDAQDVSWWQFDVPKGAATDPVLAFGGAAIPLAGNTKEKK